MKGSSRRVGVRLGLESLEAREVPVLVTGLTTGGDLVQFDSADSMAVTPPTPVSGVTAGQALVGIDYRPLTGRLYALGLNDAANQAQLYLVNRTRFSTEPVGAVFTLNGSAVGFDFDPVADRIRVTTNSDENLRVDPDTGAVTRDTGITPAIGHTIVGLAYDRNFPAATRTTLYGYDFANDALVTIGGPDGTPSPGGGTVVPVGPSGLATQQLENIGFDIGPDGTALLAAATAVTPRGLYSVNLTTGAVTTIGGFPSGVDLRDIAIVIPGKPLPDVLAISGAPNGRARVAGSLGSGLFFTPGGSVAFPGGFAGPVRAAEADVNGDGAVDIVLVTGPGTPVRFAVFDGRDLTALLIPPTVPFVGSEDFAGGAFVATADIDNDGRAEMAFSPDQGGGGRVSIFSLLRNVMSRNQPDVLTLRKNFVTFEESFRGGARPALGDLNGDNVPDLAVAAGFLGGPRVQVFSGKNLLAGPVNVAIGTDTSTLLANLFVFPGTDAQNLRNGAFTDLGDVDRDGYADIVAGGGPGGAPRVFILSGRLITTAAGSNPNGPFEAVYSSPIGNFFVEGNAADRGGIRVAVVDTDFDGRGDLVTGSGEGALARVRVYKGASFPAANGVEPPLAQSLDPFDNAVLPGGVFVG